MSDHQLPLKPQVYVDERPAEHFERYYEWASSHRPDWVYSLARLLLTPLCMIVYRVRCVDAPNVPRSGAAILAPNHFSSLDHFFCAVYLRRRVCFIAKSQLFRGSVSWILRHGGAFPVRSRPWPTPPSGRCASCTRGSSVPKLAGPTSPSRPTVLGEGRRAAHGRWVGGPAPTTSRAQPTRVDDHK